MSVSCPCLLPLCFLLFSLCLLRTFRSFLLSPRSRTLDTTGLLSHQQREQAQGTASCLSTRLTRCSQAPTCSLSKPVCRSSSRPTLQSISCLKHRLLDRPRSPLPPYALSVASVSSPLATPTCHATSSRPLGPACKGPISLRPCFLL